jgi:death-on-curing protein
MEPLFLTLAEVIDIHNDQIDRYGGEAGARDIGLLESALAVPQAGFGGELLHSSLFEIAAAYAYHISENQPFLDGNKRTALAAALIFLELNDISIEDPKGRLYEAMVKVSTRRMGKKALAALLEELAG